MDWVEWSLFVCLICTLAWITWIDFRLMQIPDYLNFAVLIVGGIFAFYTVSFILIKQITFSVFIFLTFWSFQAFHQKVTGRTGLGFGDVKMFGAASIWITPFFFPIFLFSASATALVFAVIWMGVSKTDFQHKRIPFGPFIGAGLLFTVLIQQHLLQS